MKEQDSAEGGDGEVKKAGEKAPVWSGLKTIDYERWKTPRQPDPVGIADLDLSEMVSSSLTSVSSELQVHTRCCCILFLSELRAFGFIVRQRGSHKDDYQSLVPNR